jgi:hypothetical protein
MDDREYIDGRLEDQIRYYDKSSVRNKRRYMFFKVTEITIAASIPVLLAISEMVDSAGYEPLILRGIAAALGGGVAIFSGIQALGKYQENWMAYRTTCEMLRHEKYFYETSCGPYKDPANRAALLVQRVEELISTENTNWQRYMEEPQKTGTTPSAVNTATTT